MLDITKVISFLNDYEVEVKKVPVLTWKKARTSAAERELLGLKEGEPLNFYFNMETTKVGHSLEDILSKEDVLDNNYLLIKKTSKDVIRYNIKYIPSLEGVIISCLSIDARAISKYVNFKRTWTSKGHIFISKDKTAIFKDCTWALNMSTRRYEWMEITDYIYHEKLSGKIPFKIESIPIFDAGINGESWNELCKPFLEMFPLFCNTGANRIIDISACSSNLLEFLRYKEPKKKLTKTQKKINDLIKIPLNEIKFLKNYKCKMAFIQRINDEMCVLRTMIKDDSNKKMIDGARIYVSKKEVIACRPNNDGGWINMPLKTSAKHWDFYLDKFNIKDVKGTKLEYFGTIVEKVESEYQGLLLWSLITYPFIEQLAKAGLENIVLETVKDTNFQKMIAPFQNLFGYIDTNKKALSSALGINKYQLKRIISSMNDEKNYPINDKQYSNYYQAFFCPLNVMKRIFDPDFGLNRYYYNNSYSYVDISFLDNQTFDFLLDNIEKIHLSCVKKHDVGVKNIDGDYVSYYYDFYFREKCISVLSLLNRLYGLSTLKNMLPLVSSIVDKTVERTVLWGVNTMPVLDLYKDYLYMVYDINDPVHFRAKFDPDNLETICSMHDLIMEVYKYEKEKVDKERFSIAIKRCDKWTYSDDDFSVIIPCSPSDLAREGIELHHCVASYVGRVINNMTNIMFIRKNDDLNTPFFTVEITNDSTIQQVHGFGNRNANTEPGVSSFVEKWAKAKKLRTSNFNKVR